jgi:hypothetical protein
VQHRCDGVERLHTVGGNRLLSQEQGPVTQTNDTG